MSQPYWSIPKTAEPKPTPRELVLQQWRRLDTRASEKAQAPSAKTIANLMPKLMSSIGLDKKRADLEILKVWNNLIDPTIVEHARPTALVRGTLFVTIDSSAWLDEIVRYRRREILQRLQHSFGTDVITKISFRVG